MRGQAVAVDEPEEAVEQYALSNGKHIRLIAKGRMFNLAGREPKGNSIESMDMGFTLQALSLEWIVRHHSALARGPQPVPYEINLDAARRMLEGLMSD